MQMSTILTEVVPVVHKKLPEDMFVQFLDKVGSVCARACLAAP